MPTTTFHEATATTYAGHETSFTLREAKIIAALLGNVIVEAVEGPIGGEWSGDGWRQISAIEFVAGKLRFPSAIENQTHRVIRLVWNPESGALGAVCQRTDDRGRLLDGHGRLVRDEDGQTRRADGGRKEFADGKWNTTGPSDCDKIRKTFSERTA